MTLDSLDTVFYLGIFIIPGYVIKSVMDALNPVKKTSDSAFFFSCLALSFVNCAAYSWAYVGFVEPLMQQKPAWHYWIALLSVALATAVVISVPIGLLKQKKVFYRVTQMLGILSADPMPSAWDYLFWQQRTFFALITLVDNRKFYGWFGCNSRVSSDPEERDIFIEAIYKKSGNKWIIDRDNVGVYIPKDMIRCIEFKKFED